MQGRHVQVDDEERGRECGGGEQRLPSTPSWSRRQKGSPSSLPQDPADSAMILSDIRRNIGQQSEKEKYTTQ